VEKEVEHFRAPIKDVVRRKSPFDGLLEHMRIVKKCVSLLGEGLTKYIDGDYENFSKLAKKVSELEHDADLIKGNIRAHLPKNIFMPVDKGEFLWLLREQDAILDHAENLVEMLDMRRTKIPKELRDDFKKHVNLVVSTVEAMEKAVENVKDLLETSFIRREREQTKKFIHEVHNREWQADKAKYTITKNIYKLEKKLKPMDIYHLLKIADWIDDIADHAENVADWLRAMIAR